MLNQSALAALAALAAEAARDRVQAELLAAENEVARLARECEKGEFALREAAQEAAAHAIPY